MAGSMDRDDRSPARRLLEDVWCKGQMQLLDELIHEDYVQHVPGVAQGREGLRQFMGPFREQYALALTVVHELVDGDFTVLHSLATLTDKRSGAVTRLEVLDMFRVAAGRLVEHWDGIRELPAAAGS